MEYVLLSVVYSCVYCVLFPTSENPTELTDMKKAAINRTDVRSGERRYNGSAMMRRINIDLKHLPT